MWQMYAGRKCWRNEPETKRERVCISTTAHSVSDHHWADKQHKQIKDANKTNCSDTSARHQMRFAVKLSLVFLLFSVS